MCGICGIASAHAPLDVDRLRAMSQTLLHRGPDSEGMHSDERVGIAARRLAIIDLTGGDQPIANEDGTVVVVQNGEIYNYRELQHELERAGHRFRTHCDTEVLVHGYEEWGLAPLGAAARHVRGRGLGRAHAAARARARPLRDQAALLPRARRRAGVRVRARRASARRRRPRRARGVPGVQLRAVSALDLRRHPQAAAGPHAHVVGRRARGSSASREPVRCEARHGEDEAELVEECRARLRDSVRAHLVSDVPVGVLLSGGVDSGLLAALAAEESTERVRTFSIGFTEASFDELAGARAVVAALRHDPPRADARARRGAAAARARRGVRRAVRRLVGAPDVPRLEARSRGREGRALRRGQRRALRRLLHVRRRPARDALRRRGGRGATARRPAAVVDAEGELRLQGEALHARRRSARRSSAITAGRRSSPPTRAPS